jgi:ubiquinone/menaquinone biosynthesis C-methylase UbiE
MGSRRTEVYTHSHAPVVVAAHATRTAEEAAAFVLPRLESDMRLLDIGCGPGSISIGLGKYVAQVVGLDQESGVVAEADERYAMASNVTFVTGSAYALPFSAGSFDVVYAHQVLQHVADPVALLVEAKRVLRPGGVVAMRDADYATMTHHPRDPILDRWLEIYHAVARANGGEPDAGRHLLEWVTTAGFRNPVATTSTWTYATPESRQGWAELWANRLVLDRFVERAEAHDVSNREELDRVGSAFRKWAREPAGWFAFIHGEVVATRP